MAVNRTQFTSSAEITNGTARVAFSCLNDRAPINRGDDAGKYICTLVFKKGSKDEQDFRAIYQRSAAEAQQNFGIVIPPIEKVLHDGDQENAKRQSTVDKYGNPKEAKEPIDFMVGASYIKITSKYPIALYDATGKLRNALSPTGEVLKDGKSDRYYISDIEGSLVNFAIKFNVGMNPNGVYAKPYIEWIQQCVPGITRTQRTGPKPWVAQVQPAQAQTQAPTQVMPQGVPQGMPQAQTPAQYPYSPANQAQPVGQYAPAPNDDFPSGFGFDDDFGNAGSIGF